MPDIWMDVDTAVTVPVNSVPLIDPTDFKTIEDNTIAYNAAGIEVIWHFVTTAGVMTSTPITPTTGGVYDWTHSDGGVYKIEIPASGGGSANNDTEGFGWITGKADECLPFSGPKIGFRAAALNNALIDGGDTLDVNVTAMAAGVVTASAIATDAIDADAIADNAIDAGAIAADAITAAKIADGAIDAATFAAGAITASAIAADAIGASELAADAVTEIQNGLATAANLATVAGYLDTEIAAILADTNELQTDWADGGRLDLILDARASQTSVNTIDDFLDTEVAAILEDTGTTLPAQISALNNLSAAQVNAEVVDVLRTDTIPDSYSTDGAQPTIAQAVLAILQFLTEKEVSGTTVTVNKPDGTTAAMTFTLDDGTTPTSITRAT